MSTGLSGNKATPSNLSQRQGNLIFTISGGLSEVCGVIWKGDGDIAPEVLACNSYSQHGNLLLHTNSQRTH